MLASVLRGMIVALTIMTTVVCGATTASAHAPQDCAQVEACAAIDTILLQTEATFLAADTRTAEATQGPCDKHTDLELYTALTMLEDKCDTDGVRSALCDGGNENSVSCRNETQIQVLEAACTSALTAIGKEKQGLKSFNRKFSSKKEKKKKFKRCKPYIDGLGGLRKALEIVGSDSDVSKKTQTCFKKLGQSV